MYALEGIPILTVHKMKGWLVSWHAKFAVYTAFFFAQFGQNGLVMRHYNIHEDNTLHPCPDGQTVRCWLRATGQNPQEGPKPGEFRSFD